MRKSQLQFAGPQATTLESKGEAGVGGGGDSKGGGGPAYKRGLTRDARLGGAITWRTAAGAAEGTLAHLPSPISSHPRLPAHSTLRGLLQPADRNSLASAFFSFLRVSSPHLSLSLHPDRAHSLSFLFAAVSEKIRRVCPASTRGHCDYVRRESRRRNKNDRVRLLMSASSRVCARERRRVKDCGRRKSDVGAGQHRSCVAQVQKKQE